MVTFAYEKRTGEVVSKADMASRKLGQNLQDYDFEATQKVPIFFVLAILNCSIQSKSNF